MQNLRSLVLAACMAMTVLASLAVKADKGGTITFAGAVAEFTCSVTAMPEVADLLHPARQHYCAGPVTAASAAATPRPRLVGVVHLSDAETDHVLRYFVSNVRATQQELADPILVMQTYD